MVLVILPFGTQFSQSGFRIQVRLPGSEMLSASLLFCSAGPVDVALLKIVPRGDTKPADYPCIEMAPSLSGGMQAGSPVLVIGHALFPPATDLHPTVCTGIVSKVLFFATCS